MSSDGIARSSMGLLALTLLACGASAEPASEPTTPTTPAAPTAAEASPPEVPRGAVVRGLLDQDGPFVWLVPGADGSAVCRPMQHERANLPGDAHGGWLRPAARLFEMADGELFNVDGTPETQGVHAPYRRVEWTHSITEDTLTLHSPRGLMHLRSGLLSECRVSLPLDEVPIFAVRDHCEQAAAAREPLDFGDCADVVPAFPFDDPVPARFVRVLERGGSLFRILANDDGEAACVRWRVRPDDEQIYFDADTRDSGRVRTIFGFSYLHHVLTLTGPHTEILGPIPPGTGTISMGCAESFYVRQVDSDVVTVAGERWFFDRTSCEAVRDAPPAIGTCRGN